MGRLALLLALLLAPAHLRAHPDHGPAIPWCPLYDSGIARETHGDAAVRLARTVLERGNPTYAMRMIAREARTSADAALVLAEALEQLGDSEGAALARSRATHLAP
ncbi:hypothetical protein [Vulgatibacter incomptus]|uniref:Uncharacterized protein n=1 Tax=Vulgatibacter incomptus TaxID=1391653 RepID=A0A0K1PEI8_9BACT|nr:hypothetical protein [Vulgatibacter incomptus]AKU91539.1 hypothetical protein AKJ08_1926 [Vulgatibacter incomptus]